MSENNTSYVMKLLKKRKYEIIAEMRKAGRKEVDVLESELFTVQNIISDLGYESD